MDDLKYKERSVVVTWTRLLDAAEGEGVCGYGVRGPPLVLFLCPPSLWLSHNSF